MKIGSSVEQLIAGFDQKSGNGYQQKQNVGMHHAS
jgi:hypothetical protein